MLPIRVRVTAWYVSLLALVIAALGAFVVVRLRADMTADFDRSLRSAATQIRADGDGSLRNTAVIKVLPADSGAQLIAADGRVVSAYGRDLPRAALLTPTQLRNVLAGETVRDSRHGPTDTEPFRVYATALEDGRVLLVASSLEGVDSAAHRVLVLLLIGGAAALVAIAAGGWLLSRKALRPVEQLTRQAERIEVDNLAERVPLPRTNDEIAHLAVTLNNMLDRLDRGMGEKRRLVADASHELRTPLAVMQSELDVALVYETLDPAARKVLESTREEVERMTRTVENLLTLARADDGRLVLLCERVALRDLVDEVAADLGAVADRAGVAISVDGAGGPVEADRDRIRQLLVNLVENAVKYSRPGGEVRIEAWREGGEMWVRVSDDGLGIPADALPHLFERFFRVDSARVRTTGGSGLGLAICREIALAHGGRVWAESEEGTGSSFTLALPAAEEGGTRAARDDPKVAPA
jgi:heavy metal sensor kinase